MDSNGTLPINVLLRLTKKNTDQQRDQQNDGEMKKSKNFKLNVIIIIILHCYPKNFDDLIG